MITLNSIWTFLSGFALAWITQGISTYWERRKKIQETKLAVFMSWMPFFADCYAHVFEAKDKPLDRYEFLIKVERSHAVVRVNVIPTSDRRLKFARNVYLSRSTFRLGASHLARSSSAIPQINETILLCVVWSISGTQLYRNVN